MLCHISKINVQLVQFQTVSIEFLTGVPLKSFRLDRLFMGLRFAVFGNLSCVVLLYKLWASNCTLLCPFDGWDNFW